MPFELADISLHLARNYLVKSKPVRAFAHLLVVLKIKPHMKDELFPLFFTTLSALGESLVREERCEDLFKCYEEALSVYTDNEIVLNKLGSQLYRLNHLKEAKKFFELACCNKSEYLPSYRNLQNVNNLLVERWHFRMLNDRRRNEAYRAAIRKKIKDGFLTVLDIGTGTGLLSLYARKEGADYVCACDYSSCMISIAEKVFDTNLPSYSVKLVNKLSNDLKMPDDLPFKCSLLVTETMDSGLLGERILQTLVHAWENLMLPAKWAKPVPCQRVIPLGATIFAVPIESSKISRKNVVQKKERHPVATGIELGEALFKAEKTEPYDSENLYLENSCVFLAEPTKVFDFNFNDINELKKYLSGGNGASIKFKCTRNGILDAIAIWFELHLDSDITLTTAPADPEHCSCWEHAVYPTQSFTSVRLGDVITYEVKCPDGILDLKLVSNVEEKDTFLSFVLPHEAVEFLNSTSYLDAIKSSIELLTESKTIQNALDLSPFPYAGLLLAKQNVRVFAFNNIENKTMNYILKQNDIKKDLFTSKSNSSLDSWLLLSKIKFDLIILDLLDSRGEMHVSTLSNLAAIRRMLKTDGVLLPQTLGIWCQLVNSAQLVNQSRVNDENVLPDCRIAEFINEFTVATQIELDLKELQYLPLSEKFLMASISINDLNKNGNITFEKRVNITNDGCVNAILFWFTLNIWGNASFSTISNDSYVKQAAEILPLELTVDTKDLVKIRCLYNCGITKFTADIQ